MSAPDLETILALYRVERLRETALEMADAHCRASGHPVTKSTPETTARKCQEERAS